MIRCGGEEVSLTLGKEFTFFVFAVKEDPNQDQANFSRARIMVIVWASPILTHNKRTRLWTTYWSLWMKGELYIESCGVNFFTLFFLFKFPIFSESEFWSLELRLRTYDILDLNLPVNTFVKFNIIFLFFCALLIKPSLPMKAHSCKTIRPKT